MLHKTWKPASSFWATSLALAIVALLTLTTEDSKGQEILQPYVPSILHTFLDSANVYPESVTVDQSSGTFFVGSVKEGTIYKGKTGRSSFEVLNDTTLAPDGSAYVTDSVNPVLYRVAPTSNGRYELQEFLRFEGTPVVYVNAPGAAGINVNGIVATADGRYLIIGKRNENMLFRIDLQSREIVPVNMPPGMLDTPDGLFLEGDMLYVAQNVPKSIAVLKLSPDFSQAELERTISHPTFAFPTSVARFKNRLLVVSSQFDTAGSPAAVSGTQLPVVPFSVTEIRDSDNARNDQP